jgi:hypothetical protein
MKYSTYISTAEKMSSLGQKKKASIMVAHAIEQQRKRINDLKFNILVGEVRPFKDAKFHSAQVLREREANTVTFIFKSDSNTHRIGARLKKDGSFLWSDGNLFLDRFSVRSFEKLVEYLSSYQPDIQKLLSEIEVDKESIKVINRTFYL